VSTFASFVIRGSGIRSPYGSNPIFYAFFYHLK
jgi:hypothetical protein